MIRSGCTFPVGETQTCAHCDGKLEFVTNVTSSAEVWMHSPINCIRQIKLDLDSLRNSIKGGCRCPAHSEK